ncbi:14408_t:CDS:1, partial [Rhizophagus irregularis]
DFYSLISDKLTCFSSIFWDFIRTKKDSFGVDSLTTYSGRVCLALIMKRSASQ